MHASFLKYAGLATAVAFVLALPADARAQGVYLGGAYSWATASPNDVNLDLVENNANAYKLFLGYEFPAIAGIEAGYVHFGSYDVGSFQEQDTVAGQLESSGWTVALTGRIPLGRLLTIYGKLGYFFWDAELKAAQDIGQLAHGSGSNSLYGAGMRVNFGKLSILGEYEWYQGSEVKTDLFSLGLRLTF